MALKGKWVDKIDGVDVNSANDINQVAQAVIELEDAVEESGGGTDKTLTSEGAPADAKAVGDALGNKLNKTGGTLSGKVVLPTGDQNVGFTNSEDQKIFGYGNYNSVMHMRIGDASKPLQFRGSESAPKYNGGVLVLRSELDTALGSYITDIDALIGGDS